MTPFDPSYLGKIKIIFNEDRILRKIIYKYITLGIGSFLAPFDHFYLGNRKKQGKFIRKMKGENFIKESKGEKTIKSLQIKQKYQKSKGLFCVLDFYCLFQNFFRQSWR